MRGSVVAFGADGLGVVRADDGSQYPFHSTAIADGTRQIAVSAAVEFAVQPGRQGRWEATELTAAG